MTALRSNIVKRIERLPKPTNVAGALQPLFEAISNAIHSTQEKFGDEVSEKGRINVEISTKRRKDSVSATVTDNGIGLNEKNWEAFLTTDTDNKIAIGGKGIGRLLWLDCFENIEIESVFQKDGSLKLRKFRFVLDQMDQIKDEKVIEQPSASETGFKIQFYGLRHPKYREKFPGRKEYISQHITSHFLPTFISGRSPKIIVNVNGDEREYPSEINNIIKRDERNIKITTDKYGILELTLMECDRIASSDLKGSNFVHFVAHDRTVHSHCIDAKLGLKVFGQNSDRVFHAILTGAYMDQNVNQERTAFLFGERVIEHIINEYCMQEIAKFLAEPLEMLKNKQNKIIKNITETYPSVAFAHPDELRNKIPTGELDEDAIYGHLSRERYRRNKRQFEEIKEVLDCLKRGAFNFKDFELALARAKESIQSEEQRSLAEYVVRRKVILDLLRILIQKVVQTSGDWSYHVEKTLHSIICPMKIASGPGVDYTELSPASHDLWIVDERLAFAEYFSSDIELEKVMAEGGDKARPDILIFDYVHSLRHSADDAKILLVEFKRPGREEYADGENPQFQIHKYITKMQNGKLKDIRGRPIAITKSSIFYCYVVADIIGKMDEWTATWQRTADGQGRVYYPRDGFQGFIELRGWDSLLKDAHARNQAFFDRVGISGKSFFTDD
ncbi:MAG: hypothetical protein KatS3mg119_1765 [Rhodothalassiaceae bacterium]|nr:MAG: hypothetical protein KatS3mg119_1765 [Rhodothalassiaceae bacterium]